MITIALLMVWFDDQLLSLIPNQGQQLIIKPDHQRAHSRSRKSAATADSLVKRRHGLVGGLVTDQESKTSSCLVCNSTSLLKHRDN